MAGFIIQESGQPDRYFAIKTKETIIGRDEKAQLILPHTTVSRQHAKISKLENNTNVIENIDNKTLLVNSVSCSKQTLQTKDVIQIGKFTLVFFGDNLSPLDQIYQGKSLDEYPLYTRTANATKGDETFTMSASEAKKLLEANNKTRSAKIRTLNRSAEWSPGKEPLRFGKGEKVQIDGWLVMGCVAEITWNGSQHVLTHKSMLTAVSVNGQKISTPTTLKNGDAIQIASNSFIYTMD